MVISALNLIQAQDIPEEFSYNQSILQAFYYFTDVTLNGMPLESDDWVAAFNGDVCVGARQWDTSSCGSSVCDIPAMGDDGSDYLNGYMLNGDIPNFKIFDASTGMIYNAIPSNEIASWAFNGMYMNESLEVDWEVNPSQFEFNGSITAQVNLESGTQIDQEDVLAAFSNGEIRGVANSQDIFGNTVFSLMVYSNVNSGEEFLFQIYDFSSNLIINLDESLIFTSDMIVGDAINPFILNENVVDIYGCTDVAACNYAESANEDDGSCGYATENYDCGGNCITNIDECGICGGDNLSCTDCNGFVNGNAYIDGCGDCVDGDTGLEPCSNDCSGNAGGLAAYNGCNVCICNGETAQNGFNCVEIAFCELGCNGLYYNIEDTAPKDDECGICGGDGSTCLSNSLEFIQKFSIENLYPNPFNPSLSIDIYSKQTMNLDLAVYSLIGDRIDDIYYGLIFSGISSFEWNPESIPSGIYFINAISDNFIDKRKVVLKK